MPRISVLIPIYNGSRFLADTLTSLKAQIMRDFEVLCLDDCSTDDSRAIVEKFSAEDSRFRPIFGDRNRGSVPPVLNEAMPHVRGEYLVYSSQDDTFSADWLERMLDRAEVTGADAVLPDVVFIDGASRQNHTLFGLHGDRSRVLTNRQAVEASLDWSIHGWALLRSSLVKSLGYATFCSSADEYSTRLFMLSANKVAFSKGIFFSRQDNPDAITKKLTYRIFNAPLVSLAVHDLMTDHEFSREVCATQLLRSINHLLGYSRLAVRQRKHLGARDAALAAGDLAWAYDQVSPRRMTRLFFRYFSEYRWKSLVKLFLFSVFNRFLRYATVFSLTGKLGGFDHGNRAQSMELDKAPLANTASNALG